MHLARAASKYLSADSAEEPKFEVADTIASLSPVEGRSQAPDNGATITSQPGPESPLGWKIDVYTLYNYTG